MSLSVEARADLDSRELEKGQRLGFTRGKELALAHGKDEV